MPDLNPSLVVFLSVFGAGFAVVLGCAMHVFFIGYPDNPYPSLSDLQREYMREVRMRNQIAMGGYAWNAHRG